MSYLNLGLTSPLLRKGDYMLHVQKWYLQNPSGKLLQDLNCSLQSPRLTESQVIHFFITRASNHNEQKKDKVYSFRYCKGKTWQEILFFGVETDELIKGKRDYSWHSKWAKLSHEWGKRLEQWQTGCLSGCDLSIMDMEKMSRKIIPKVLHPKKKKKIRECYLQFFPQETKQVFDKMT